MMVAMHTRKKPEFDVPTSVMVAVLNGQRPTIPEDMPGSLAELAQECWSDEPEHRPACTEVLRRLKGTLLLEEVDEATAVAAAAAVPPSARMVSYSQELEVEQWS